jgi:hypothetical protein
MVSLPLLNICSAPRRPIFIASALAQPKKTGVERRGFSLVVRAKIVATLMRRTA